MIKNELQNIISGTSKVKFGETIQTITRYLRGSQKPSEMATNYQQSKRQETENLLKWINKNNFWVKDIDFNNFISSGAEQRVYLINNREVLKLNDAIYYSSWLDYFNNLLLNNYFFPDTAYELLGFYQENEILYAVVKQKFIKANEPTLISNIRNFMIANGFEVIRNNDYRNSELGIILEDLHDENVLTYDGILAFIDTVFYIENSFYNKS